MDSVIREVKEETGLDIANVQLCGIKQFPLEEKNCRYIVLLYKTSTFYGELKSSEEGQVFWIEKDTLKDYVLAESFETMLEVFENNTLSENYWWVENEDWNVENK